MQLISQNSYNDINFRGLACKGFWLSHDVHSVMFINWLQFAYSALLCKQAHKPAGRAEELEKSIIGDARMNSLWWRHWSQSSQLKQLLKRNDQTNTLMLIISCCWVVGISLCSGWVLSHESAVAFHQVLSEHSAATLAIMYLNTWPPLTARTFPCFYPSIVDLWMTQLKFTGNMLATEKKS